MSIPRSSWWNRLELIQEGQRCNRHLFESYRNRTGKTASRKLEKTLILVHVFAVPKHEHAKPAKLFTKDRLCLMTDCWNKLWWVWGCRRNWYGSDETGFNKPSRVAKRARKDSKILWNGIAIFCDMITEEHQGENILIVTHAGNVRVIDYYFNGKPKWLWILIEETLLKTADYFTFVNVKT